jgi:hypothetical protein
MAVVRNTYVDEFSNKSGGNPGDGIAHGPLGSDYVGLPAKFEETETLESVSDSVNRIPMGSV